MNFPAVKFALLGFALSLAIPFHAASAQVIGKTIKANYEVWACYTGTTSCGQPIPGNVNIYVGTKGTIFDYARNAQGIEGRLNVPGPSDNGMTTTWRVRGNSLHQTTANAKGNATIIYTIQGSTCSVSATGSNPEKSTYHARSLSCTVVSGLSER